MKKPWKLKIFIKIIFFRPSDDWWLFILVFSLILFKFPPKSFQFLIFTAMATQKLSFLEKIANTLGTLYRHQAQQFPRRLAILKAVGKHELAPPRTADLPAIKADWAKVQQFIQTKQYVNLTVKVRKNKYIRSKLAWKCSFFPGRTRLHGCRSRDHLLVLRRRDGRPSLRLRIPRPIGLRLQGHQGQGRRAEETCRPRSLILLYFPVDVIVFSSIRISKKF